MPAEDALADTGSGDLRFRRPLDPVAKIRNDKMPDINREESEDKLKQFMLEFETLRDIKDREILDET